MPRYAFQPRSRPFAGLTARRRQLGLPIGNDRMPLKVWRTVFRGGAIDGSVHRMIDAPERWAVYMHRQAHGIVKIQSVHETRLQEDLWDRFTYKRVALGEDFATYVLVTS
jgi:hypothetical protein